MRDSRNGVAEEAGKRGRPRLVRRIRSAVRVVAVLVLLGALLVAGLWRYVTRSENVARLSAHYLEEVTGAKVSVEGGEFSWRGPIVLRGITMSVPGMPVEDRLLEVGEVRIDHDPWQLLTGSWRPERLTLAEATLYATESIEERKFNFQILQELGVRHRGPGRHPERLPEIQAPGACIQFGVVQDGKYVLSRRLNVDVQFVSMPDEARGRFSILAAEGERGPALTGDLDFMTGASTARLEHVELDSPLMNVLPEELRRWWLQREPKGALQPIVFSHDPQQGSRVTMIVDGVELTPPYAQRPLRMKVEKGRLEFVANRIEPSLEGTIDRFRYKVEGRLDAIFSDRPTIDLQFEIAGDLDADPQFVTSLDEEIRGEVEEQFRKFRPSGPFEAWIHLTRRAEDDDIYFESQVMVKKMDMTYDEFPYPLTEVEGSLTLYKRRSEKGAVSAVEFRNMTGRGLTGADITVSGWVTEPALKDSAMEIRISPRNIPIDEHLRAAVQPDERRLLASLFNEASFTRLAKAGLLHRPGVEGSDGSFAYDMGGEVDAEAVIRRTTEGVWSTDVTIELGGERLLIDAWPYPLVTEGGRIVIGDRVTEIQNLRVRGLTGAQGLVKGRFVPLARDPSGRTHPELTVEAKNVPVDELLLATLPESDAGWLRTLHVEGTADGQASIFADDDLETTFSVEVAIAEASATPHKASGGRYSLERIRGDLLIEPGRVVVGDVRANHGESELQLSGKSVARGERRELDFVIEASNLRFEDPVLDLIPPDDPAKARVAELDEQLKPRGVYDATLSYKGVTGMAGDYSLAIRPRSLQFRMGEQAIALSETAGSVTVTPERLTLEGVEATMPGGRVAVSGWIDNETDPDVDLRLDVQCESFSAETKAMLPRDVLEVLEGMGVQGGYHLRDARLSLRPRDEDGETLSFAGQVHLSGASLDVGVPITELNGVLGISATDGREWPYPQLEMRLSAEQMRVLRRMVSPMSIEVRSIERPGDADGQGGEENGDEVAEQTPHVRRFDRIVIDEIQGSVYGGSVTGAGTLFLTPGRPVRYRLDLALQETSLQPVLQPEQEGAWEEQVRTEQRERAGGEGGDEGSAVEVRSEGDKGPTGYLSARLAIEGLAGQRDSIRGAGQLLIEGGRLYQLSIGASLLRVLNLTLPGPSEFRTCSARYDVRGNTVAVSDIGFRAPSLEMRGRGVVEWDTGKVDMTLYSRNPDGLKIPPFSGIWDRIKSELFSVRVTGTLEEPQINVETMSGTRNTWDDLFGGGDG